MLTADTVLCKKYNDLTFFQAGQRRKTSTNKKDAMAVSCAIAGRSKDADQDAAGFARKGNSGK